MTALETGAFQFVLARLPLTLATSHGAGAIRRATRYILMTHLALPSVGQAYYHKTVVEQLRVKSAQGSFLATVLGSGAHESASNLTNQCAFGP